MTFLNDFIFKSLLHPPWGLNSQPRAPESHALPTEQPDPWSMTIHTAENDHFEDRRTGYLCTCTLASA